MHCASWLMLAMASLATTAAAVTQTAPAKAPRFANGLPSDANWFPLGVWVQSPQSAKAYQDLGINLFVGLYGGPTEEQLTELERVGMRVICHQNEVGLRHQGQAIVGWMHGDEPDNAQARRRDGYEPPIQPAQVVADYERLHKADPTRPILLNLGQGAAWDGWRGRGERTNHPEDYPQYCKGCDVVSFDIYPVTHSHADVKGQLEFVGNGVLRLRSATQNQKPVWAVIETAHVANPTVRPTAEQVRTEVWQAIACGASGVVYFAHEFAPTFVEAGLLAHPEIAAGVKQLNAEVLAAAPVLNGQRADAQLHVAVDDGGKLAVRTHEHAGALHVFTASLQSTPLRASFLVCGEANGAVHIAGEEMPKQLAQGRFSDDFAAYGIRHYRIPR